MIRSLVASAAFSSLILAVPASAAPRPISVSARTVGEAAYEIARQTGANFSIQGSVPLSRRVPAIRGRLDAASAFRVLAKAGGFQVRKVGPNSFILTARPPSPAKARGEAPARAKVTRTIVAAPPVATVENSEIVVTASKRDTRLRSFPGQWARIDGDVFRSLGVAGSDAIESRSDGFSSTHLGAGRNKLFIRGIADSSFSGPTQSPVGQYFGDTRTSYSGPDPDLKLVDMQAVEILAGPQGTLYGSGALGGIVLLKPNMPAQSKFVGNASVGSSITAHGDAGYDISAVLNAPVWSGAAIRLTGYAAREGGYIDNQATGSHNINDVSVRGGRGILSAEVSPGWMVDFVAAGQDIDGADSQYAEEEGNRLTRNSLVDQPFSSEYALGSVVIRKDSGLLRFRSTTTATRQEVREIFDASLPGRVRDLRQSSKARAVSNETRVWRPMEDGYSWLAGVSTIVHTYRIARRSKENGSFTLLGGATNRVRESTAYGEVGVQIVPAVDVSAGARFTVSEISGQGMHLSPLAALRLSEEKPNRTERRLLPTASILVRAANDLTFYGRYQQGFRPGGLSIANDVARFYENDRLATGEIGFRWGAASNTPLQLQGSATLSRWRDIQADYLDPTGLPVTDNIGDGRVWTINATGSWSIAPDLRLEGGLAWNRGRITNPTAAFEMLARASAMSTPDISLAHQMSIPNIAKVVARAAIDWRSDLGSDWSVEANAYARYVGKSRLGVGPQLGRKQGQYLDTGAVVRLQRGSRGLSLSVLNLIDEVGDRFAFGAPIASGADQITPLRPRTIRLGFEQAF